MKYGIVTAVILVILGATGLYFYNQNQKSADLMMKKDEGVIEEKSGWTEEQEKAMMEKQSGSGSAMEKAGQKMMTEGPYVEYSQAAFEGAKDKKRVLFFYANWCPICKPADADFKANLSRFPKDLVLFRVNYDDSDTDKMEKALAAKYGITYQHTFVEVDGSGKEIKKWNGGQTDKLLSEVQ